MKKIAVICASVHHGNTKKLVQEIGKEVAMDYYSVEEAKKSDLSSYEMVCIATGLYFRKFHKSMLDYLAGKPNLPKDAFAIITCGDGGKKHAADAEKVLREYGLNPHGAFVCRGFDTYGPFKLIGGINKNHPDETDIRDGIAFVKKLCSEN